MSTQKHTPVPWHLLPYQYTLNQPQRARIHGAQNEPVIDDANPSMPDAARIVACVNACEGINPEAVPDLVRALGEILEWVAEREADNNFTFERDDMFNDARAALAKAKGGR